MVFFVKEYPDIAISQQDVGQIHWGHNTNVHKYSYAKS